jgi:multidrug transporter EmrE-like cation transporter
MVGWLTLATAILFNVLGNYFIKRFSISADLNNPLNYFRPLFMSGVLFFGVGLLLYTRALAQVPITLAYPIMVGLTLTTLSALAIFSLGEQLTPRDAFGAAFVVAGIALLSHAR